MPVKPIPDGYHTVTPYLIVQDAVKALAFYQQAFGAKEMFRMQRPDGKIGHAEIMIGDSPVMLADEAPEIGARGPQSLGGTPVSILLYVENADKLTEQAVAAGATILRPLQNHFYGDRSATLGDPFGHTWHIATHVEDVSPDEMRKRAEAAKKEQGA